MSRAIKAFLPNYISNNMFSRNSYMLRLHERTQFFINTIYAMNSIFRVGKPMDNFITLRNLLLIGKDGFKAGWYPFLFTAGFL